MSHAYVEPMGVAVDARCRTPIVDELGMTLDHLQKEIDSLRAEVSLLRRRDETLNLSMQRIDEELRLAARLQQDFLPKSLPQVGRTRFRALFRPAGYVSGDLYDVWRLDENHVGFYLSDAVGHGMPAALLTMFIKNALNTKRVEGATYRLLDPAEVLQELNEMMVEQALSHATFATAVYGLIDTRTLEVRFSRAGHPHPMVLRKGGTIEEVQTDGGLLGIFSGEEFPSVSVKLEPGDRLLLYTDGVEVAFSDDHTTVDADRWRVEIGRRATMETDALLEDLVTQLDSQVGSLTPKDDLTMIIMDAD